MKLIIKNFLAISILATTLIACDKEDEGEELDIHFKTEAGYVAANTTLPGGTTFTVGIEGSTKKKKDPIIKFNISESINGRTNQSVYSESLETTSYNHDETFQLDTVSGTTHKYTFTITNRDGRNAQETLVIEVE